MFRENDYLEYEGDYTSMKRVDEQGMYSLTAIKPTDGLVKLGKTNTEKFYTSLRLFLTRYGIPLIDWHKIQSSQYHLVALNPETTKNYKSAKKVMSRSLFQFFKRFLNDLFDGTTHFAGQLSVRTEYRRSWIPQRDHIYVPP
jgi:hypothetical protein